MGTYLNFDDSKTIFSGRTVKSSFIWAWSPSRPSGVTKNCEKMSLLFWMFLTKRNTFYFFLKNNILLSTGPGCFALGPGPREFRTFVIINRGRGTFVCQTWLKERLILDKRYLYLSLSSSHLVTFLPKGVVLCNVCMCFSPVFCLVVSPTINLRLS